MIEVRMNIGASSRKGVFRSNNVGEIMHGIIEREFYRRCNQEFGLSRDEVKAAIRKANTAFTSEVEEEANADRLYAIMGQIVNELNKELNFSDGSGNWAKLEVNHI